MKIFSVYLNDDLNIEKAKFISSGFSFKAFVFSFVWALFNRLWLFSLILVLFDFSITLAFSFGMIDFYQIPIARFSIMFYAGFSGNSWKEIKHSGDRFQETIIAESEIVAQKILFENFIFSENLKNK